MFFIINKNTYILIVTAHMKDRFSKTFLQIFTLWLMITCGKRKVHFIEMWLL